MRSGRAESGRNALGDGRGGGGAPKGFLGLSLGGDVDLGDGPLCALFGYSALLVMVWCVCVVRCLLVAGWRLACVVCCVLFVVRCALVVFLLFAMCCLLCGSRVWCVCVLCIVGCVVCWLMFGLCCV